MARKGRKFELSYQWLYALDENKYTVTSPAYLYDRASQGKREVDVLVEYVDSEGLQRKIGIECRDRKSVVDVTGIEQLKQKKEDLGLDFLIVTTTKKFTAGAINKAKYYDVMIEEAEMLNRDVIDLYAKQFYVDFFFYKFELRKFDLLTIDNRQYKFKEYLQTLNFAEQNVFVNHVNEEFYCSIDPNEFLNNGEVSMETFFENQDNSMELKGNEFINQERAHECMKQIAAISWEIKAIPYKLSLPIYDSLSVFEAQTRKNKNYCVKYGGDEEYLEIGYLDGKSYTTLNLQPRKYYRFAGAHIELNTVFPEGVEMAVPDLDDISRNLVGKFDMSKLV